jgi:hypothetical protein
MFLILTGITWMEIWPLASHKVIMCKRTELPNWYQNVCPYTEQFRLLFHLHLLEDAIALCFIFNIEQQTVF